MTETVDFESKESKRAVFGWAMYDWANSAYVLTVATAVLPAYFAQAVVPGEGIELFGTPVAATVLWGLTVSFSGALVFLFAPFMGALADLSGAPETFLRLFCFTGAAAAFGLSFTGSGDVFLTLGLFALAHFCFALGNVFYDGYLPRMVPENRLDRVSGKGFAFGYVGGGLQFLLCLGLIAARDTFGLSLGQASRLSMGFAAVWWAGFALITFARLPKLEKRRSIGVAGYVRAGFSRALGSWRTVLSGGPISFFLLAYLLYNDGIQTVITMATIYGKEELGLSMTVLMVTLLIIQFVAFGGALGFSRLAEAIGPKRSILIALCIWTGVSIYGYFIRAPWQFFLLGMFVGLVLGGSQALSRSLFARLIPEESSSQYFGYFSVVNKLSAIGGPLVFAAVRQLTGTSRLAVAAVAVFFIAGMLLLAPVDFKGADKPGRAK